MASTTASYHFHQQPTFLSSNPLPSTLRSPRPTSHNPRCTLLHRRTTLQILGVLIATNLHSKSLQASIDFWPFTANRDNVKSNRTPSLGEQEGYTVFEVKGSDEADVNLEPMTSGEALDELVTSDAVFLGEKHNSLADHALQAKIIEGIWERRGGGKNGKGEGNMVVGLEQVQTKFQGVLDDYIARKRGVGEEKLFYETEWEKRWVWPFEKYLPIFRVCREKGIPLIALSVNSEVLEKVQEGGLEKLSTEELHDVIRYPEVFAEISREAAFKAYVDKSIIPSYGAHVKLGILGSKPTFSLFYSTRVMRDEVMAATAASYVEEHPNTLMIGLVGSDHVKFSYGVPLRMERQLIAKASESVSSERGVKKGNIQHNTAKRRPKIKTVMLNPTPNDAIDPRDSSLMLELAVGEKHRQRSSGNGSKDLLLISDLLWFSSTERSARPRQKAAPKFPPVEELVFPGVSGSLY
eukprot:Plantae.Rhodophyta-Hildenbrandia_rubra.ctg571.p3 GENE.Plantae.Rhodophyta-Hildenbrandia_rubra.ctg571~~Plantae.Rhodophyta-Hildenbrandia_rubra.ctg571.p3  ORF type:complete len:465 (+),score=74.82 Plantae.Rhodophyta-Hildenbrandia_rubra.ctg571:8304-9698(+)